MSNVDEKFYETKSSFFGAFVSFTWKSILGMAVFLVLLAIFFT
jgi:hypothetical protein